MRYTKTTGSGCPVCSRNPQTQTCARVRTECAVLPVLAFVPPQVWDCTYTCGQALARGTLFPALDKPFMGKGGCCNG